jgi:hypothetical protein
MKYLLILLLLTNNNVRAQNDKPINYKELFNNNSLATYSLMFAGGFSDGLTDCVIANKFYNARFWGRKAWIERHNLDGFHVSRLGSYAFYSSAVAINLGTKQNWKYYVVKGLISFAASRAGHELCYNVIFKNYPK